MGGDANAVHLITDKDAETWDRMSKADVARRLAVKIAEALA
jgi:phosphopantothenoylcysteine decarboxylase/phosphopantothenate--cysteine ligase